jgi:osmotically-inducible protein OsmY
LNVIADDLRVHPPVGPRRSHGEICAATLERPTADPSIRSTHNHVKVSHGRLTLNGYVGEQTESAAAAYGVASLRGVSQVTNRIEIR